MSEFAMLRVILIASFSIFCAITSEAGEMTGSQQIRIDTSFC